MDFEIVPYVVYVKSNSDGYIIAVNSSLFLPDTTEWVEIDSGYGDKYGHAQGNYFPQSIVTESGAFCYKLVDGMTIECTPEEIREQEEAILAASTQTSQSPYITWEELDSAYYEGVDSL